MDSMAQPRPPQILYISRDYLKADAVAANRTLERRAEDLCRTLRFTHPYLTIESVSGPAEMWYLNGFASQADVEKLTREYQQNTKLLAALNDITQQKVALKRQDSTEEFAHYRSHLSSGDPWIIGRGQFFVIVLFDGDPPMNGTVFEMKDGSRMLVRTTRTSSEARALAASAGSTARVFRSFFYFRPVDVDFGTYHHSTPEESKRLREYAERAFSKLLRPLYPSRAALRILDAGCGLGFLTYVVAKRFPKASVAGVDLFKHGSVSELSIDKAMKNMKSLGMDSRTSFLKHDLTKPLKTDVRYDLAVSNLVFHNLGKKRFKAYGTVFDALKPGGYFVIGDLFPHGKGDMDYFRERSTMIDELHEGSHGRWDYKINVLRKA